MTLSIAEHGMWVVHRIEIVAHDDEPGAQVVMHGNKLHGKPGQRSTWRESTLTFDCASHLQVLRVVKDLLAHTTWWGVG